MDGAEKLSFTCKWSKSVITITSSGLFITLPMLFLLLVDSIWVYLSLGFVFGVLGYYACISPQRLIIDNNKVIIKRILGKVFIPIEDILEIRLLTKVDTRGSIRKLGSDGFFGYTGWFYNKYSLGNYYMYATDETKLILIRTEKKKYVVSCTQPQEFVKIARSFHDIS